MTTSLHLKACATLVLLACVGVGHAQTQAVQSGIASKAEANGLWNTAEKIAASAASASSVDQLRTNLASLAGGQGTADTKPPQQDGVAQVGPFRIAGSIQASSTAIYTDPTGKNFKGMAIKLAGACVSRRQFIERYPNSKLLSFPTGRSSEEAYRYATVVDGMQLVYEFPERAKNCASAVKISPEGSGF
jgi:hypothetical protein